MQRIINRASRARSRIAGQAAQKDKEYNKVVDRAARKEAQYFRKPEQDAKREERRTRKEDWQLGPLAPRRDAGLDSGIYGSATTLQIHWGRVPEHRRSKYDYPFRVGDRVVLLKGRDQGRIGKIRSIEETRREVYVDGLNKTDILVSEDHKEYTKSKETYSNAEAPMHFDDVLLVAQVDGQDQIIERVEYFAEAPYEKLTSVEELEERAALVESPKQRSSIEAQIEKIRNDPDYLKRFKLRPGHEEQDDKYLIRRVAGTNIKIAWPEKASEPEKFEFDSDTPRLEVEDPSYTPRMQSPPFPSGVIDELRFKYAPTRTRFEPEEVAMKEANVRRSLEREEANKNVMLSPLQLKRAQIDKAKAARPPPELKESTLAAIGELLAQKRGLQISSEEA